MGNFHVKPKSDTPEPAPPPAPKAKVSNTQAGAVACDVVWPDGGVVATRVDIDYADELLSQYKWRDCKKVNFVYSTPPAAVPVEALEGLVAKWLEDAKRMHAAAMRAQKLGNEETSHNYLDAAKDARGYADELIQIIKERSNG